MSVPLDFAGVCALVSLAGAIGRRAFVYPKAMDKEWKESLCISGSVVASSGAAKTPVWKTFTNVLAEQDIDWQKEHAQRALEYKKAFKLWEKMKEGERGPEPVEPKGSRRLILNDTTPEKLQDILQDNPSGVLFYRDELSSWVSELSKKGYENQRGLFLAAMNGNDIYSLDRIGRGTVTALMAASVFGSFQPNLLRTFLSEGGNRYIEDGLIPRFTFMVWPDGVSDRLIDRQANAQAKDLFRTVVRSIASMQPESLVFHFEPRAQVIFNEWYAKLASRIQLEPLGGERSYLSKLKGGMPKIAALLQLVDLVARSPMQVTEVDLDTGIRTSAPAVPHGFHQIDVEHVRKAIQLTAYLESHMRRVFGSLLDAIQSTEYALVKHLKDGDLKDGFTAREIGRRHWAGVSKVLDEVEMALENLADKNWVRLLAATPSPRGGRPSLRWEINPAIAKLPK